MNKLKVILSLLLTNLCFGQDISIAKQDTVYIILPESESYILKDYAGFKYIASGNSEINEIKFLPTGKHPILLNTRKIGKENKKVKRKSFFESNINRIITLKFIETYSPKKVFVEILGSLDHRKVIYIIDENQLKKRKIILKKAFLNIQGYIEM